MHGCKSNPKSMNFHSIPSFLYSSYKERKKIYFMEDWWFVHLTQYKKTPYLYRLFHFFYLRVPGVASNVMRNVLFQFTGILLTSIVFKLFTHESMVGFLHVKVSYPTTHLINSLMLSRIQNLLLPSKNKINCLWSNTFINIYNREISKPTGFKNRQPRPVSYTAWNSMLRCWLCSDHSPVTVAKVMLKVVI